jgi:hypothetical protein
MELKDVAKPKWMLETKRGWGMVLTFIGTTLPFVSMLAHQYLGVKIDAPMVALVGEAVNQLIDSAAVVIGVFLWVWGSFRPTAPIALLRANLDK